MRKIVGGFAISLDGYIEGKKGEYDWMIQDDEVDFQSHMLRFDTFLFGRISYEKLRMSGGTSFPGIKNYVISTSLKSVEQDFTLLQGSIPAVVAELKGQEGKDIAVYGGARLLTSLLDHHLVDELDMSIMPVILGSGKPMLDSLANRTNLAVVRSRTTKRGVVRVLYHVDS